MKVVIAKEKEKSEGGYNRDIHDQKKAIGNSRR